MAERCLQGQTDAGAFDVNCNFACLALAEGGVHQMPNKQHGEVMKVLCLAGMS